MKRVIVANTENVEPNFDNLEIFTMKSYGTDKCCSCGTPLVGDVDYIGDTVDDDEGYYWRGFCHQCASKLGLHNNVGCSKDQIRMIYQSYKASVPVD